MTHGVRAGLMILAMASGSGVNAAERKTSLSRETFACVSWAAWHDYTQASLTAKGARASKLCPLRIPGKSTVTVMDEDAGEGATEVLYQDKHWFIDADTLK